jgi:hypothetical protein
MRILARIRHDTDKIEILRGFRVDRGAEAASWREPLLTAGARATDPAAPGEIVGIFHDARGKRLREIAWPGRSYSFYEHMKGPAMKRTGGVVARGHDVRELDAPRPDGAARLSFERREVAGGVVKATPLGSFALDPKKARRSHDAFPFSDPVSIHGLRGGNGGHIVDWSTTHGGPPSAKTLDIVVLGDGFQRGELGVFRGRADHFARRIFEVHPFDVYKDRTNIHRVVTQSNDSGVDNSPLPGPAKDTYYDVTGMYGGAESTGFFGTDSHDKIIDAIRLVAPPDRIDLVVMLVNAGIYGGHGDFANRTAYVPIVPDDDLFMQIASHEIGHALGGLTDEYLGEEKMTEGTSYPNLATEKQRIERTVPWWQWTTETERVGDDFRVVHQLGDPVDPNTQRPILPRGLGGMVGLFWGCSFIDWAYSGLDDEGDAYLDARGARFYRPMAACKMRWFEEPFCRVCVKTLRARIERSTGPLPPPPST